jgi:hypothetical protein
MKPTAASRNGRRSKALFSLPQSNTQSNRDRRNDMTTVTYRSVNSGSLARAAALCLLALAATLLQSRETRAQWTTSGTTTSTTNNVGVGTTTPIYPITVVKDQAGATAVVAINRADTTGAQASVGVSRTLDWSSKYLSFGVTAPSFGVPGLNDTALFHSAGVPLKFGSETANDILFFTNGYNNTRMTITGAGNVGIGAATPGVLNGFNYAPYIPLHIQALGGAVASVAVDSAAAGSGFVINDSSQPLDNRMWSMSQGAGGGKLTFATHTDAGVKSDKLVLDRSGNVGVGTSAPTARLHVAGDIRVDGNINAKYQDVAEWVPSRQRLSAGTVVVVDPVGVNGVLASASAYDTGVAGVVSEQPGLILGDEGEGKVKVATTGRVRVKVDATSAPVRAGDLLVSGEREGYAMKSQPVRLGKRKIHSPGTIIGKALESLEKGTGEILVLLSLQ